MDVFIVIALLCVTAITITVLCLNYYRDKEGVTTRHWRINLSERVDKIEKTYMKKEDLR